MEIRDTKRDHSKRKNPTAHDAWMKTKRAGRPRQVYIATDTSWTEVRGRTFGHWERVGK